MAWTCPHCQQTWQTKEYCIDCGVGTSAPPLNPDEVLRQIQEPLPLGPVNGLAPREVVTEAEQAHAQQEAWLQQALQAAVPPATREQEAVRSLEVENTLREELHLLRERQAQLVKQHEEERQQVLLGLQRLLEPLMAFWKQTLRLETQPTTVIADTVHLLTQYRTALMQQTEARPAPDFASELGGRLARLEQLVASLVPTSAPSPQPPAAGYPSFVVTDQRALAIERELLAAQRQEPLWR